MEIGVYRIRNTENQKCYIGSTAGQGGLKERWRLHQHHLTKGDHHSIHFQRAWHKYGAEAFIFEVIEYLVRLDEMTDEQWKTFILAREQYYLDTILFASCNDNRFHELGYNICRVAGSPLGVKRSEESKQKMRGPRPNMIGPANPMYGKRGEASPNYGLKRSEETKLKMSKAMSQFLNKLKDTDKIKIQQLLKEGYTQKQVAKMFGVCRSTIDRISNNKTWRNR